MWYVYICDKNGQLYTGITTDLEHRMNQHKASLLYSEAFRKRKMSKELTSLFIPTCLALCKAISAPTFQVSRPLPSASHITC
jgi:predicted GIY-YIG superfamily endonuclease